MRRFCESALAGLGFLSLLTVAVGQGGDTKSGTTAPTPNQEPSFRREAANEAVSVEGLIRLDVVVTDSAGNAVLGLKRTDFKVIENGSAQTIVAFRAGDPTSAGNGDALSVILLLDTIDQEAEVGERERRGVAEFLRQNAGKLTHPVTIYSLEPAGFFLTAEPSTDGESLAADVLEDRKAETYFFSLMPETCSIPW